MRRLRLLKVLGGSLALVFLVVLVLAFVWLHTAGSTNPGVSVNESDAAAPSPPGAGASPNGESAAPPEMPSPPPQSPNRSPSSIEPEPVPAGPPPPMSSDDDLIEQSLARLKKGNLAYNTPQKMKTGQTARVTARIAPGEISLETLESGMPSGAGTTTATAPTPISTRMKMTLKSADFNITQLSSEEQFVGGDTPTEWEWDVVPKHAGTLSLHLAAVVELGNLSRDFTSVDREIAVRVDPIAAVTNFAAANTVWIFTTLGGAIAALWAWWRKRRKRKTPDWETPE